MKLARDALRGSPDEVIRQLRVLHVMLPRLPDGDPGDDRATDQHAVADALGARLTVIRSMLCTPCTAAR